MEQSQFNCIFFGTVETKARKSIIGSKAERWEIFMCGFDRVVLLLSATVSDKHLKALQGNGTLFSRLFFGVRLIFELLQRKVEQNFQQSKFCTPMNVENFF
jgi:hypothetical protein